jgi:hypothetical protein
MTNLIDIIKGGLSRILRRTCGFMGQISSACAREKESERERERERESERGWGIGEQLCR